MNVRVKICGITSLEDALEAVDAGADALGFMFYAKSPRFVPAEAAGEIIRRLPPFVAKVGVFVNPSEEEVRRAIAGAGIDTVQFHGAETTEFCARFGLKVIKAFRIRDEDSLKALPAYKVSAWLLDSYVAGEFGGTGEKFSWDLAVAAGRLGCPVILAGGLKPENVADAVRQVRPFGVDVSSGVEAAPGRKAASMVRAFVRAAKTAGGL